MPTHQRTHSMASAHDFKFIMETILGEKEDSPLSKTLKEAGGVDDIGSIIGIAGDRYINRLNFRDDSSGTPVAEELGQCYRALLCCFKAIIHMKIDRSNRIHEDWQNLTTKADFQAFYIRTIGFILYTATQAATPTAVSTSVDTTLVTLTSTTKMESMRLRPSLVCPLRQSPASTTKMESMRFRASLKSAPVYCLL